MERFGRAVAEALGLPALLRFDDWSQALRLALGLDQPGRGRLVVLDEFPYLLHGAPELASAIQAVYDDARNDPAATAAHLVLCGSAFTIMSKLLSGARPLRGRSRLDLVLPPFDYRTAREFWGITDHEVALRLHAVLGGTPGYRDLTDSVPQSIQELDHWLAGHVLNPAHALFSETDYLLREDPTITDRALYQSVLAGIANGHNTPGGITAALGRDARSLWHPLDVLRAGGFVRRSEDVLTRRRPIYTIADPIIRFGMLIVRPRQAMYEERRAPTAWEASTETFATGVLGPHLEDLAREWTRRFAATTTLGGPTGIIGQAVLNDPTGRSTHELDVIALADGEQLHARQAVIRAIGEAKATTRPRSVSDLDRLDRIRVLLGQRGHDTTAARLLLFSRTGFTAGLLDTAHTRNDVELIDLTRLYTDD
ncbi:MAG: AAA family ATPase [Pseudonocardiales bacterium]